LPFAASAAASGRGSPFHSLGGVQYLIFSVWLFFAIGRKQTSEEMQKLSAISPLLFVPVQAVGWVAWGYYQRMSNPELVGIWEPLIPFAVYTLVIGYLYVGIVNLTFLIFKQKGVVNETPAR
jgi:hypothetical protein